MGQILVLFDVSKAGSLLFAALVRDLLNLQRYEARVESRFGYAATDESQDTRVFGRMQADRRQREIMPLCLTHGDHSVERCRR